MSTPAHPQTDGQSERAIRSLEEMLRAYISKDGADWETYLPALEFAYNNRQHSSTGQAPFELVYGSRQRTVLDYTVTAGQPGPVSICSDLRGPHRGQPEQSCSGRQPGQQPSEALCRQAQAGSQTLCKVTWFSLRPATLASLGTSCPDSLRVLSECCRQGVMS